MNLLKVLLVQLWNELTVFHGRQDKHWKRVLIVFYALHALLELLLKVLLPPFYYSLWQ